VVVVIIYYFGSILNLFLQLLKFFTCTHNCCHEFCHNGTEKRVIFLNYRNIVAPKGRMKILMHFKTEGKFVFFAGCYPLL